MNLELNTKKTRKREFLEQMEQVVSWLGLVELIAPYYPEGRTGRPPFSLQTMLRVYFLQQWFTLSDPAMEEAFFDTPVYREFAQLEEFSRPPDESTILRFRHRLEKHKLTEQILPKLLRHLSTNKQHTIAEPGQQALRDTAGHNCDFVRELPQPQLSMHSIDRPKTDLTLG